MSKEPIFPESKEAATFMKVEGWVSRDGRFYGKDERAARWGGATHVHCRECGEPCPKNWLVCEACQEEEARGGYLTLPAVEWDESVPVYSPVTDTYYFSRDEMRDDVGMFDPRIFRLVLCKPIYADEIDPESYYEDLLPEGYDDLSDVSQDLVDIFDELNSALTETKVVLSYEPSDMAVI